MSPSLEFLTQQLELADELLAKRAKMFTPQDLPGRYGCVVQAVDRVLQTTGCPAVLAGGWAVWHHGYIGRVTQDLDIVLPADRVEEFLRTATVSGFDVHSPPAGRWPKLTHRDTGISVDVLPEGGRPGTPAHPAPTTIPHPGQMGAAGQQLTYVALPRLVELKLAAGRVRDDGDITELLRTNPEHVDTIRRHLEGVHPDYIRRFDELRHRADEQQDG